MQLFALQFKTFAAGVLSSAFTVTASTSFAAHSHSPILSEFAQIINQDGTSGPCYYQIKDCYSAPVGSALVDTKRLSPYHAKWVVKSRVDGAWFLNGSTYEERLNIADKNWKHVQVHNQIGAVSNTGVRILDGATLKILNLNLSFMGLPPEHPVNLTYDFSENKLAPVVTMYNGTYVESLPIDLPVSMYDRQIAGVTLAALPLSEGFVATLPFICAHTKSIYRMEARVTRQLLIDTEDGDQQKAWEVQTTWINLKSGDISEGGRNESGGAYYIAVSPGNGVPYIIEYVNNSVALTWDGVRRRITPTTLQ